MVKKILAAGFSFVLLSCLSIESKMALAANGSGTLELVYTVSAFARDWEDSDSAGSPLPLPVNEEDFRRGVAMIPGLSLTSYSRTEEKDNSVIRAVIGFTSVDALNSLVSGPEEAFTLRQEGSRTVFEQTLTQGTKGGLDGETLGFVQAFFAPYSLRFSLTAPRGVAGTSPPGNASGNTASVSFPLADIVRSETPVMWRVEW